MFIFTQTHVLRLLRLLNNYRFSYININIFIPWLTVNVVNSFNAAAALFSDEVIFLRVNCKLDIIRLLSHLDGCPNGFEQLRFLPHNLKYYQTGLA